jgi:hypothetical protein
MQEAFKPGQAEGVRSWVAELDRRVPGELLGTVGHRKADTGQRAHSFKPGDVKFLGRRVIQFHSGQRGQIGAHPGPQCAGVEEALHRRGQQPFYGDIDDQPWGQLPGGRGGQCPERKHIAGPLR